ncbi:MAG TPA: PepSY-like domain-containing protein, partial [Chitinophagaceae bacterium]
MKIFSVLVLAAFIFGSNFLPVETITYDKKNESSTLACGPQKFTDTLPPVVIQTSFTKRYPSATNVRWYRYSPTTTVVEPGYWYSTLDPNDYYVSFMWNDDDYIAWYDNNEWIYSTQRIDNTALPEAVSRAISSQYPGFIITDVDREHDQKQMLYEVKLQKGNQRWNVHYTPEGAVFKKKQRDLTRVDAETAMSTDFEKRYPNSSEVVWYKYDPYDRIEVLPGDWNYNMDANDYEVIFTSDGNQYVAYYDNG